MATIQDLFTALHRADEAGNTEDAKRIAEIIHGLGYGERPAAPKEEAPKKRSMTEAATDVLSSFGSGVGQFAQLPGQIGTLAGIYGPEEQDTGLQGLGKELQQFSESKKTDILKQKEAARAQKIQQADGFLNEAKAAISSTITDPALLTSFFAEQVPNLIGSFGFGAVTKGGTKLLMRNATEQALQKAGVRGAIGGGAIMQGADIGSDTYEETLARLKKNDPNIDPAKANELALSAGRKAAIEAAALSLGVSKLPGGATIERALAGRNLPGAAGFVRGTLGETFGEGIEEGGGALAKNLAMAEVVPGVDIGKGVGAATGLGALGGFMMGAPASLVSGAPLQETVPTLPQVHPRPAAAPEGLATLPTSGGGFDAERAAALRAQADQAEQDRLAGIEAGRLAEEAAAQEAVRGMPAFAGTPDINAELVAASRADRAEEQKRLEAERRAQIKQIENTQFSTDPFQDQIMRNRALQQMGVTQETAPAAAPKAVDPLAELTQEIPELPTYKPKAPPKTVPMSEEDMEAVKAYKQDLAAVEKQIAEAKKSSTDLFKRLDGAMSYQDVLEVAPEVGNKFKSRDADTAKRVDKYKKLVDKTGKGRSLSSMVADGSLNEYLPPNMRIGEPGVDEAEAVQYIYDKLASGDTRSFDESQAMRALEEQRATLQELINDPQRRADLNYQAQTAAAQQRGVEPLPFGDLIADAQARGVDTDAVMERVAMQMPPDATPAQYQGEVRNQIDNEIAAREGRPAAGAAPIMEELPQQKGKGRTFGTAEGAKIEKELTGKNFDQLVQWSINNAPNRFNKLVAQKVAAMIRALKAQGVEMQFDLQGGTSRNVKMRGAEGITTFLFSDEGTNVFLQLNGEPVYENQVKDYGYPSGMSYGTIQHELLHVATRAATRWLPKDHPAIKDLNELYKDVVYQYNKDAKAGKLPPVLQRYYERRNNALESADELITWGLTDREFQEYLSNIKVGPKQTAFNKLVSLVREMLGIAKPFETAMEKLVRTTDSILETDIEVIKGSMEKLGYAMGKAKPPTTQLKQQSLFSKRVQQLLQDDLMVRKNGFYFDAKESPLYQARTPEQARVVSNQDFESAVRGTKTGQRIMDKNIQIKDGDYVGVRLDLNILRSTGVPVQSIHQGKESTHEKGSGFFNGEVIKYAPWVTLKNVRFKIQQGARERIASGQETKSPMGSADGQYVATDKPNFDGIELRFNPNREHLFRDALGRAVKYADEITTTRNGVFARGNIEYFGEADVPPVAKSPSESRLMREGEMQAKEAAQKTGSVPAPIQESLFAQNGLSRRSLFGLRPAGAREEAGMGDVIEKLMQTPVSRRTVLKSTLGRAIQGLVPNITKEFIDLPNNFARVASTVDGYMFVEQPNGQWTNAGLFDATDLDDLVKSFTKDDGVMLSFGVVPKTMLENVDGGLSINDNFYNSIQQSLQPTADAARYFAEQTFGGNVYKGPTKTVNDLVKEADEYKKFSALSLKDQEKITRDKAFKKWFGDSKVVDENGKPMVVYHATDQDISVFNPSMDQRGNGLIFFASDPVIAEATVSSKARQASTVMPVYLKISNLFDAYKKLDKDVEAWIKNNQFKIGKDIDNYSNEFGLGMLAENYYKKEPQKINGKFVEYTFNVKAYIDAIKSGDWQPVEASPSLINYLKQKGYDGFKFYEDGDTYAVIKPNQIKSAIGNRGTYAPEISDILLKQAAPQRTQLGNDTMEMLEGIGRTVAAPEPGYTDKVRQSWDNYRDNPQATREAAYGSFRRFADQVETWAFSSDAGLNNQIRREIMNSMVGQEKKIGMLLNTSLSQTAHSDAVSNLFLMEGNIRYDTDLHKWVGVKDENNIINLSKKLDEIADKLGLTKPQVELMAHTAFEARRTQELNRFNEQIERQAAAMKEQARIDRAAGRPVAASALNEKANNLLKKKKITTNMTPEALQTGLRLYDMHPGLKEVTKIWNGIRQNALDRMVESGLYTAEEAEMLMSAADYVPFFREDQIEEGKGPKEFLRSLAVQADKRLKGSSKPVNDIFDNMVRWTQYAINRGVRNRSGLALATTAQQMGLADRVQDARDGENVVTVWEDGKKVYFSMQDPMFVSAFRGLESVSIPTVKFFSKFADVLRQSVVLYPLFSIAQVPQDSFAAMFTSGLKPQHALTIPVRAVKEFIQTLRGKSKAHEELKNVGAVGVRDFTSAIIRADAEIAAGLKEEKGLWAGVKRRLGSLAMAADNAVRQATYEAALAQGLSRAEAIEKAFEIFNVRRRGNSQMLAMAGQVIPFFNAYLAAQHVAYRTLTGVGTSPTERKAAFQTLAATTGSVMALSLLYAMMNGDDDDYLNKPTPTRDRLLMIPGTGGWGSIPLRADIFALPKVLAEHTYLLMTDNGYEDPAKFRASMASLLANSIFSPTPVPQAIKPLAEAIMNYDFFQQKPLVGTFQQRKELKQQFEDSTSEFAKVLGSTNMVSPIVADHFIRGMFGSFGGLFLYMTNPILADMAGKPRPTMSYQDALATIPNASGFVSKEYEVALRKDFYALKEVTDRVGATISDMKTRSPQELADYLSDEDVRARYALTPAVNQIAQQLTKIRTAVNAISQAPEERMSDDEKQEKIRQLREAELRLLKGVNLKALRERANI